MFVSVNRLIKEALKQTLKESNSIKNKIILVMQTKGKTVQFEGEHLKLEGKYWTKNSKQHGNQSKNASRRKWKEKYTKNKARSAVS